MAKNGKSPTKQECMEYYKRMLEIRRFEERAGQLYSSGFIGGFCHLCIGQEAVAVGISSALKKGDHTITSYRDHGIMLAMGADPKSVMCELTGRIDGCSKGKGGSMHMFDTENGFWGGHGIVGAQIPIGTGIAFACKYKKEKGVCVTLLGDGASNQGQFFEAMNMAKLWNIPVIYVIENNMYGMGTSVERASCVSKLHEKGVGLGIPGVEIDGMDVYAVKEAIEKCTENCRKGKGPSILSINTYRYRGHSMSDPATYRSKEEVEGVKNHNDPIEKVREQILKAKFASEAKLKEIDKDIRTKMAEVAEFAKTSPLPDEAELWTDIYKENA